MDGKNYSAKNSWGGYRASSLSYLRIFATIMVVASHAWSTLTENSSSFSMTQSEIIYVGILSDLTKWAVPCFLMITGALLLKKDKEITVSDCIWKYARRMLLALVIFGIPYAMLMIYFDSKHFSFSLIPESIIRVLNGDSFGHLWYLYTLIGIYLFLPFIKLFVNNASKQVFNYIVILLFIMNFCFPFVDKLAGTSIAFEIPIKTWPLFFVLSGYYLYNEIDNRNVSLIIPTIGIGISVLLIIIVNIMSETAVTIMSYNTPVNALFTISVFILFIRIRKESTDCLWKLDRLCFGAYLIHPLFIQFCYRYLHLVPTGNTFYPILTVVFACVFALLGFFASWVMSQIKPLKKYVL